MTSLHKKKSWYKGLRAEKIAKWVLRVKLYRVLEERYKSSVGEIDLIARKGSMLIFVEVKARKDFNTCIESVSFRQQNRIRRAAELYLSTAKNFKEVRFDVFLVKPYAFPVHIKNAF